MNHFHHYNPHSNISNWKFEVALALRLSAIPIELDVELYKGTADIAVMNDDTLFGVIHILKELPADAPQNYGVPSIISVPGDKITTALDASKEWLKGSGIKLKRMSGKASSEARKAMMRQINASLLVGTLSSKSDDNQ